MKRSLIETILEKNIYVIIFLTVIGLSLYSFTLRGEFLHMDDLDGVVNHQSVQNLSLAVRKLVLKNIVNSVLLRQFGANPFPFHLVNIFLHIANSVLLFFIVKLLFNKKVAFLSSLLFLVHPASSEAVSWISGSIYLYQALFWLITIYLFILWRKSDRSLYIIGSVLLYILYFVLVRSVWGLVLPLVLLTLDYFILNRKYSIKKFCPLISFALITFVYIAVSFTNLYSMRSDDLEYYYVGLTSENRVVSMFRAVDKSMKLFVAPYKLNILFGNFDRSALGYLGLLVSAVILLYFLYYFHKKNRVYFGLLIITYIAVLPIFSPISIGLGYAERYFYFSSAFFSILAISLLLDLQKRRGIKELLLPVFVLIFVLLSFRTFIRTLDWKNDETIWRSALAVEHTNNYKAYLELGNVYYRDNDLREALIHYEKALEIRPQYPEVLHNVGLTYLKAGQLNNAKAFMQKSLQLNPKLHESYYRLGQIFAYEGNLDQARAFFLKTLQLKPNFLPAQDELSKLPGN